MITSSRSSLLIYTLPTHHIKGHGVLKYSNNDTLEGMFRKGQPHGIMRYCFHSANNKTRKQRKAAVSMDHSSSVVSSPSDKISTTSGKRRGGSMYVRSRYVRFEYGRLIEWLAADDDDEKIKMERKLLMMRKESDNRGNARNNPKR